MSISVTETLLERNADYITGHEPRPPLPSLNTIVISCVDARVDPAHILGLDPGEAVVLRNAGGRVTEAIERDIGLLIAMASNATGRPVRPEIVLVHHTDCGVENLCRPEIVARLGDASGIPAQHLEALAIADHDVSLREDFKRLVESVHVPAGPRVSGLCYDQSSGRAELRFAETLT